MANIAIATYVTDNWYQNFLPTYIYSIRKEYPDYQVKTFLNGRINDLNKEAFDYLQSQNVNFDYPIENL